MKIMRVEFLIMLILVQFSVSVSCQPNYVGDEAKMGKAELFQKLKRVESDTYEANIHSGFFNSEVKVLISQCTSTKDTIKISDCLLHRINEFTGYIGLEKDQILSDIFSNYKYHVQETAYGMVPDELLKKHHYNYEKANQEYFNIYTKEEAFKALNFKYAKFIDCQPDCNVSESTGYYILVFERPWDTENQLEVEFEKGKYKELF